MFFNYIWPFFCWLGACLADDMGLGKTLQVLSLLLIHQKRRQGEPRKPSLLVVPASLLGNWKQEAERFTPSLKLLFVHLSEASHRTLLELSTAPDDHFEDIDLVITTYSMVIRQEWLLKVHWDLLILDEAQAIKNDTAKQSRGNNRLFFFFTNFKTLSIASAFSDSFEHVEIADLSQHIAAKLLVSSFSLKKISSDMCPARTWSYLDYSNYLI